MARYSRLQCAARQTARLHRTQFDAGYTDEAFRIATALRVIFHQTNLSTSLLTHLGSPNVEIRSAVAAPPMPAGRTIIKAFQISLLSISMSAEGGRILPRTQVTPRDRMIPWSQWWDETFATIHNCDYTRKSLVLWACNKDGGAHVDHDPQSDYEAIKASGALGSFIYAGQEFPIEDAHLVFLRSMAFEVLNSPQLRALTQPPVTPNPSA